ncbi:MAG: AAA family ATPase [Gemmataceae bacterium]
MAKGWRFWPRRLPLVRQMIVRHMGDACETAETISHTIRPIERVNLQLALEQWLAQDPARGRLIGYSKETVFGGLALAQLLQEKVPQGPIQRQQVASSPDTTIDCVMRGIYLLHLDAQPIAILVNHPDTRFETPTLELMAHDQRTAQEAMKRLLDATNQQSVYKGRTILLEEDERTGLIHVRFHTLPPTPRESLVLPEQVLTVIERNVLGLFRHREVLRRANRAVRQGLLFHGPPGTGKTLMLRYLASSCPDHTVILLSGRQMNLIRETCQVARLLAPALVLMEDIDLVAEERSGNRCPVQMQDLMDEMDGLGTRADVSFLLTTNRPEALEPALSARPGRIDQAIEFPLPDEGCRRRLFLLYGKGLELSAIDLDRWISKTDGVSPAFIEELLRKGALMAAERGETSDPLALTDDDLARAMDELICFGGELTQKLLGFRPFGFARR